MTPGSNSVYISGRLMSRPKQSFFNANSRPTTAVSLSTRRAIMGCAILHVLLAVSVFRRRSVRLFPSQFNGDGIGELPEMVMSFETRQIR